MIRNAVIHLSNEQPLLCDLPEMPETGDVLLRCTNLRTKSGERPVFVDRSDSIFFFPYAHIRFLEIPSGVPPTRELAAGEAAAGAPDPAGEAEVEADLELDEDFLRRIREV